MFQLIVRYVFTVKFKQQYQSKMQRDLVDFSSSKTISNAKLANNDFQLIVDLTLIPNREGLCAVPITSYSPSEGAHTACRFIVELDAAAKDVQAVLQPTLASVPTPHFEGAGAQSGRQEDSERVRAAESQSGQMIVDSVSEDNSKIFLILQNDHAIFCEG
jgi:hypothetical protein